MSRLYWKLKNKLMRVFGVCDFGVWFAYRWIGFNVYRSAFYDADPIDIESVIQQKNTHLELGWFQVRWIKISTIPRINKWMARS